MSTLRIALAQINATVGDLAGNRDKILGNIHRARNSGAALVAFPELAVTGYPPEDLLFKPRFIEANMRALDDIVRETQGIAAIVGFVDRKDDIYNAAAVACDGQLVDVYHKSYLPNYGVFDEDRYFQVGNTPRVYRLCDTTFGVNICEDIWYPGGPAHSQALHGDAELIVNISASPFYDGKGIVREQMLATRAADCSAWFAFCNLVGGQDELVFDGGSLIVDQEGALVHRAARFKEDLLVADIDLASVFRRRLHDPRRRKEKRRQRIDCRAVDLPALVPGEGTQPLPQSAGPDPRPPGDPERLADIYDALVLGTRDYVHKNGFSRVYIGLSGGIDSALTTVIARDALGCENVVCATMPSAYTSDDTFSDARQMAEGLGVRILTLPIQEIFVLYLGALSGEFEGLAADTAEENIQPRIRGTLLMALANKFHGLVLAPGNKSEMSMGYATLYGDMVGGFAVIKDIYKTMVYDLAHFRNGFPGGPAIPSSIIQRPPTAELKEGQLDTDSLPPYPVLDPILEAYVEEDRSLADIVQQGYAEELVGRVIRTVDRSEYKRRQSPPGIKITPRAFGRDRRLPITNHCSEY